ncbi:hypothetical protein CPJCM30710_30010 [Clostridium polyendosporum]|uniref:Zinc-ribbon domain-containing protein n=1 Tax=Clostridium polyendosporum TaxID=69208 RepID=A0A919S150_9CLOT|nr:zinc ribbon domain-containing protein [Clostridium polyendosporum]GIM30335.1 hypothetical protein CPJCM30710_30010 [Clostridium polyendosporum]
MIKCEKCGISNEDNSPFCSECGDKLSRMALNYSEKEKFQNGSFVALGDNEIRVKTYHCTTMKKPQGEGYLTVTNKRVIFHGYGKFGGGRSRIVSEVPIESVSGIGFYYGKGLNIPFIILGVILSFLSLYMLLSLDKAEEISTFIELLIGLLLACLCLRNSRKCFYNIWVYSSGASSTPIDFGNSTFSSKITGQAGLMSIVADVSEDTELLMKELGALVLDLKTMGDYAISKWLPSYEEQKSENSE